MISPLQRLSSADLQALTDAIKSGRVNAPFSPVAIERYVGSAASLTASSELQRLTDSGVNKEGLLYALELLLDEHTNQSRFEDLVELVWTGPEIPGVPSRDTSVVVRELFSAAKETVLLAGYAVYQGREIFASLAKRMEELPALTVQMYLDVQRLYGDTTLDSEILREFAHRFKIREWPGKRLPTVYYDPRSLSLDSAKKGSLHAKSIVIDNEIAFVSSANFTTAAQVRNIEVGALIRSRNFSRQLASHFESLAEAEILRRLPGV